MAKRKDRLVKNVVLFIVAIVLSIFMFEGAESTFQNDSESLAVGPIAAEILGVDVDNGGYGLGILSSIDYPDDDYSFMGLESVEGYEYSIYSSQVGLQGMIYVAITHLLPKLGIYDLFRIACCFFLVVILMMIIKQLYIKYGTFLSAVFGIVTFLSPWIVDFSKNLYWVEFTWFVPMLLGLLCLNYEDKKKYIYPLFFVAVFIKCLCGYEYLSTIMMSGIMFLLVEWVCNKEKRKNIFKTVLIIGVVSVAGFICAYVIHAYMYGSGNIIDGLKLMQVNLIEKRTFGNAADFDPVCADSLNASIFDVLLKYFWTAGGLLAGRPLDGKLMLFIAIVTIGALIYQRKKLDLNNNFEICLFIVTLLTTLSWLVLGKSHSYVHTHMNFVLFYMGWVQVSIYIICKTALDMHKISVNIVKGD